MKKYKKFVRIILVLLFAVGILSLTGCGRIDDDSEQMDIATQYIILEEQHENPDEQVDMDVFETQNNVQEKDEEAEIIEQGHQEKVALNGKTQEQMDAEDLAERAMLEEKVQSVGGVSEEEAVEIAKETMEIDIGERSGKMKLHIESAHGWKSFLRNLASWKEYRDKGEIAYFFQFDDTEDGWYSYHCVVNAVDGSILGAYGLTLAYDSADASIVYYEH